jgi:predicted transcriptional regulator
MKKNFPKDPRGGHVRLHWELMDSPAWKSLAATDICAYLALSRQKSATNNGDLSLTATMAKHHGIKSKTTLAKSLRALVAVGLIYVTRKGGCARGGQRLPTLYAVSCEQVYEQSRKMIDASKATFAWKTIKNIAHGRALIKAAEEKAKESSEKAIHQGQNLTNIGSKNEPVELKTRSKNGPWAIRPGQIMDSVSGVETAAKPVLARLSTI